MVTPPVPGEWFGAAAAGFVLAVLKSLYNGWLNRTVVRRVRNLLERRKRSKQLADDAHSKIEEIGEVVEETREIVGDVKELSEENAVAVEENRRTMVLLHEDDLDPNQHEELRKRLDVDRLDSDLVGD